MKWLRRPHGYLSADHRLFIERGGEWEGPRGGVDPTRHMWLVWRPADQPGDYELDEDGVAFNPVLSVRPLAEVTGQTDDGPALMIHVYDEGWLADAKALAEAV